MNALSNVNMKEITRLTRAGRLREATSMLQRGLGLSGPIRRFDPSDRSTRDRGEGASPSPRMLQHQPAERDGTDQTLAPASDPSETAALKPELMRSSPGAMRKRHTWHLPLPCTLDRPECEPLPSGASFATYSVKNAGRTLFYKLYVPSGYKGQALPLVVMLHGCTQSPDDFAAGTRMNELAEELLCLVAYPEQTKAANGSKCWNWFKPGDQQRGRGEPALVAAATRQIMREFSVDPARVFVAGLSAGGAAAAIMGHEYPDLYKGVCVHSGLACGSAKDMPSAFAAMRSAPKGTVRPSKSVIPTIVFHGSDDKTVSPTNANQIVAQFKANAKTFAATSHGRSAGGMPFTRTVETNEAGEALSEQWILQGAGHAWSGGSRCGTYTDPAGPDASREMMRFFMQLK